MKKLGKDTRNKLIQLIVSLIFLIIGFFDWKSISGGKGFLMALYYVNPAWIAVILCGFSIFKKAIILLKNKQLKVPVLVSVAMIAAITLEIVGFFIPLGAKHHSYVFAAGEIAFLMSLGGWIESLTVKKCKSGIERLVNLIPKEAFVKSGDRLEKRKLADINIGDIVVCKSGELIAVDGEIIKGSCAVDQSSVTGEYVPVDLSVGDTVYGGTMNTNGTVEIKVTKLQQDMTIAKMAELVKEAEGKKAPIARIADKWVSIIVPSLFLLSIIVGLIANFALKVGVVESIVRAITVLVVFCPCAFALATPTAIAAGLGNSAKNGILIKSGASLEEMSRIDTVCFDKTGTITEGKVQLSDIIPIKFEKLELIKLVASVEKYSEHPLAVAVMEYAKDVTLFEAVDIETVAGVGISAKVDGKSVAVSSLKNAISNGLEISELERQIDEFYSQGKTIVVVMVDNNFAGVLAFTDTLRSDIKTTIADLKTHGYEPMILTGDNENSAKFVADFCGIDEVRAELMPEEKLDVIKGLQKDGHKVCMLGDGINDAPALKLADVSMAMGALGSDIAIDSADMAILNSDIKKLNSTLKLSKRVMNTIKRNIIIAMSINLVAVGLSLFGILNPATGALMHNFTSLFVVTSSAFLLKSRKKTK